MLEDVFAHFIEKGELLLVFALCHLILGLAGFLADEFFFAASFFILE